MWRLSSSPAKTPYPKRGPKPVPVKPHRRSPPKQTILWAEGKLVRFVLRKSDEAMAGLGYR